MTSTITGGGVAATPLWTTFIHLFMYHSPRLHCGDAGCSPVGDGSGYGSPLWGGSTPPVCCSEIWSALLLSQPVLPLAVQTLNVRCGLSVPAQKSHCRFWLKWIEGSFFLRFGQRLPQQPFARVQPTKAFKTDSVMCGLSGELCHLMLLAVTSWERRPLNVGMLTDACRSEAY